MMKPKKARYEVLTAGKWEISVRAREVSRGFLGMHLQGFNHRINSAEELEI
jgi:hypothetical protein